MKFDEFESSINQLISVSATPSDWELEKTSGEFIEQIIRPTGLLDPLIYVKPTKGQIDDVIKECKLRIKKKQKVLITTLTKRMAEDLTDYLNGANIATDYLHSDIDSIKRVQILRSLRVGVIDVLVGINLLREGLDLPEVSLVIVLDADKEGFLRSKSSLMQVSGRAARNNEGNVFFYADKVTDSMKYVIDETNRRRKIQKDHNKKYNIVPKTIIKSLEEINLSTRVADEDSNEESIKDSIFDDFDIENIESQETLEKMKREMLNHAKNLQFEKAALLRDKIKQYEQKLVG